MIDNVVDEHGDRPRGRPVDRHRHGGAQYQILPPTLNLTTSKSFFADENGNYQTDSGEHAVIGENSGVSMLINAQNTSAFPIAEIVITEPAPPPPASEFDKFDADLDPAHLPGGSSNRQRRGHVRRRRPHDSKPTTRRPGRPRRPRHAPPRVTSITVTYSGPGRGRRRRAGPDDRGRDHRRPRRARQPQRQRRRVRRRRRRRRRRDRQLRPLHRLGGGIPAAPVSSPARRATSCPIEDRNAGHRGDQDAIPEPDPARAARPVHDDDDEQRQPPLDRPHRVGSAACGRRRASDTGREQPVLLGRVPRRRRPAGVDGGPSHARGVHA